MTRTSKIDLTGWSLIGYVGVDSGQVMVGDPCYLNKWGGHEFTDFGGGGNKTKPTGTYDYNGACTATCSEGSVGILGNGLAAVSPSGFGDGQYGVYVKWSDDAPEWGPRVAAMMVVFIEAEEEEEAEECEQCGGELVGFVGPICDDCEEEDQTCECGEWKHEDWAQCGACDERDSEAEA